MRYLMPIVLLAVVSSAAFAAEEGYNATIAEKADLFLNDEKIATMPESALFHATRIRANWVYGTYTDVDTGGEFSGWVESKFIADIDKMRAALKIEAKNYLIDAERRYQEKRYRDAISLLSESLDRDPNQPHALMLRAESFRATNNTASLIADLSKVIEISPKSNEGVEALLSRADLSIKAQRYAEAVADLKQVLAVRPDEAEAYLYLGDVQYLLGKYRQAAMIYIRGMNTGRRMSQLHHKLGLCYFNLNMFDDAVAQLEKALELKPNNAEYARALKGVNDRIAFLASVTPEQAERMLDIRIEEKDDQLFVAIANKSQRPLIDVEIAMVPFVEDVFERRKDELMGNDPSRDVVRGALRRDERTEPLDTDIQKISYLAGTRSGTRAIPRVLEGQDFSESLMNGGMDYVGYVVMVFVSKKEVFLFSSPKWLARDFEDTILDIRVDVQGVEME